MAIWHIETRTQFGSAGTIDLLYKELSHSQTFQNGSWMCIFRVSQLSSGRTPGQCFVVLFVRLGYRWNSILYTCWCKFLAMF